MTIRFSPFMLMYGFQPRSLVMVGLANEKIHQVKDFLKDHILQATLMIMFAHLYNKNANTHRRQVTFYGSDMVFLCVPKNFGSLKRQDLLKNYHLDFVVLLFLRT